MAQKDTQLLGEILNVQKAILSKMSEQEKKEKDKDKKEPKVEAAQVEAQGFTAMIKELQSLNSKEDVQKAFQELLALYQKTQQKIKVFKVLDIRLTLPFSLAH